MSRMTLADFEALYRREADPWSYETSPYEHAKYAATLDACGPGRYARALELGASIGVLSASLASRCERLVTIDGAPTAVARARARLRDRPEVDVRQGTIPADIPDGPFDLVLASEILYYLTAPALAGTFARLREVTAPGARLVAVHWRREGPERPFGADEVHARLREEPWVSRLHDADTDDYRLDVFERRR